MVLLMAGATQSDWSPLVVVSWTMDIDSGQVSHSCALRKSPLVLQSNSLHAAMAMRFHALRTLARLPLITRIRQHLLLPLITLSPVASVAHFPP
jgi:hypothetical protein